MPIYEFKCSDCSETFEILLSSASAIDTVECQKCGSKKVRKTISAASFRISSGGSSIPSGALSGCSSKSGFS